jgi:hypothetical protein
MLLARWTQVTNLCYVAAPPRSGPDDFGDGGGGGVVACGVVGADEDGNGGAGSESFEHMVQVLGGGQVVELSRRFREDSRLFFAAP